MGRDAEMLAWVGGAFDPDKFDLWGVNGMLQIFQSSLERHRSSYPPISDVAEETSWWQCFSKSDFKSTARQLGDMAREHANLHSRQSQKTGRNDPCPCGSGKKYKKCCGA